MMETVIKHTHDKFKNVHAPWEKDMPLQSICWKTIDLYKGPPIKLERFDADVAEGVKWVLSQYLPAAQYLGWQRVGKGRLIWTPAQKVLVRGYAPYKYTLRYEYYLIQSLGVHQPSWDLPI